MFTPFDRQRDTRVVHKTGYGIESIFKCTPITKPWGDHIALLSSCPPPSTSDFTHPPSFEMADPQLVPELGQLIDNEKAFENTSTSVAASQMRNALNNLADTVTEPEMKKVRQKHYKLWLLDLT